MVYFFSLFCCCNFIWGENRHKSICTTSTQQPCAVINWHSVANDDQSNTQSEYIFKNRINSYLPLSTHSGGGYYYCVIIYFFIILSFLCFSLYWVYVSVELLMYLYNCVFDISYNCDYLLFIRKFVVFPSLSFSFVQYTFVLIPFWCVHTNFRISLRAYTSSTDNTKWNSLNILLIDMKLSITYPIYWKSKHLLLLLLYWFDFCMHFWICSIKKNFYR